MSELEAGRELDARVAEGVFGWRRMSWRDYHAFERANGRWRGADDRESLTHGWHDAEGNMVNNLAEESNDYYQPEPAWSPSTDIAAAFEVLEEMMGRVPAFGLEYDAETGWSVWIPTGDWGSLRRSAPTAPLAICRAALAAADPPKEASRAPE